MLRNSNIYLCAFYLLFQNVFTSLVESEIITKNFFGFSGFNREKNLCDTFLNISRSKFYLLNSNGET